MRFDLISNLDFKTIIPKKFLWDIGTLEKKEFKKIIKEIGFSSQRSFAENIGVKATTFTTYKSIPSHIVRIVNMGLMARRSGISFDDIQEAMKID